MPYVCRDREWSPCSGRAYKRPGTGTAWILCRVHWHQMIGLLNWCARR